MVSKKKCVRRGRSKVIIVVIAIVLAVITACLGSGVAVALLLPGVQQVREAQRRQEASKNLKRIADALHGYHQEAQMRQRSHDEPSAAVEESSERIAGDAAD